MTQQPAEQTGPVVLYERVEGFARITLNRPDVLNAINRQMQRELYEAFQRAIADDEVKAIILHGAGRAFSAGGDLTESSQSILASAEAGQQQNLGESFDLYGMIWNTPKPVISAIHGHAVGQATELACICDITIAAEGTRLGEIQIRHGYGPPVLIAPYLVSMKHAKEILMLGELIDAQDALRMGLVNKVVPADQLMAEAEAVARKFASIPAGPVLQNKQLIHRVYELAHLLDALQWRTSAPFADVVSGTPYDDATLARLRTLRDSGWEAFRDQRDQAYGERGR